MKLKPYYSTVLSELIVPCAAALLAVGMSVKWPFVCLIIAAALWVVVSSCLPSGLRKKYPGVFVIHDGCALLRTYRMSILLHIVEFILLKIFFDMTLSPTLVFIGCAVAVGFAPALGGTLRLIFRCTQLSIGQRTALALLWWLPPLSFIAMRSCEKTAWLEFDRESARIELDNVRAENEVCKTKYPILLVHGIFFRDLNFFNYWGRVPKELIKNGATVYYGDQRSAASVEECAGELKTKIEEIINATGCGKVNVIAHSKGGLDIRYAASCLGMNKYIASITTINTPHKGCEYADFMIEHAPQAFLQFIAARYNSALAHFGENGADFSAGVSDLTAKRCAELNKKAPLPEGVYCRSFGSYMKNRRSAGFPLNCSYLIAKLFSRSPNDGLVDLESMRWGESFDIFEPKSKRGLSHGDMIDLFREDISGFDVREEYVNIVSSLKSKGF